MEELDKRLLVQLRDGRKILGILRHALAIVSCHCQMRAGSTAPDISSQKLFAE